MLRLLPAKQIETRVELRSSVAGVDELQELRAREERTEGSPMRHGQRRLPVHFPVPH